MSVLFLTEDDVRNVLTMDLALPAVEAAFRKLSLDEATNIPRKRCQTDHVMLHMLPAAAKTLNAIGFKAYTTSSHGAKFHIHLFDPKTGDMTAILQADYLGQVRTGAASGVATKKLSRQDGKTVGIIGAGKQARTQLEAIGKVRAVTQAFVYSPTISKREAFAAEMSSRCGFPVSAIDSAEVLANKSDIICTASSAREPILKGEWLKEGTHLNLCGSNFLAKAEVDSNVFRKANLIVADSKDQAKAEAGDFVEAMKESVFSWTDVTDLCHILTGRYPGRQSEKDITIFKSLGLGIQDIAVAVKVVEKAKHAGIGRSIDLN